MNSREILRGVNGISHFYSWVSHLFGFTGYNNCWDDKQMLDYLGGMGSSFSWELPER
jgi:hypothetical protein